MCRTGRSSAQTGVAPDDISRQPPQERRQMIISSAILLGLEYALLAVGVYVTFRVLDIPDLTVDGSFVLGMVVSGVVSVAGAPELGLLLGFAAGGIAGAITGFLITYAKINPLLAGIITMTGLYTINITILGGPNLSLMDCPKIFTNFQALFAGMPADVAKFAVVGLVVLGVTALLAVFFRTEVGLSIRACGDNEAMVRASSIGTTSIKIATLALANALVGLSGALLAQYQGFADIGSGSGMIVVGLASVIIGELFGGRRGVTAGLFCAIGGSIVYRVILAFVLSGTSSANAVKLVSALIVGIFLSLPAIKAWLVERGERRRA